MSMSVGERDEKMNKMASIAAEAFCETHTPVSEDHIKANAERFLEHTIPYLTVRTLHRLDETLKRQETALKSLEADSRSIRRLTFVLVFLTIVLAYYAVRDTVIPSLQSKASQTPSPTATTTPSPTATATP
jgi:hypothetical protein